LFNIWIVRRRIRISRWRSRRVRELAKVNIEDRLFKAACEKRRGS
jgi:hypothetical protein